MIEVFKKIKKLLPPRDHIKLMILLIMMLVAALLEVLGIGMLPAYVSIIVDPDTVLNMEVLKPIISSLGIESGEDLLVYGASLLMITFILKNIYLVVFRFVQSKYVWNRFVVIGSNLFDKYMHASYEFHLMQNTSELLRNVTLEAQYLTNMVLGPMLSIVRSIILILGIITLLVIVEPVITIGVILILGSGSAFFLKIIKVKTKEYGRTAQEDRALMIRAVNEGLGGLKETLVLNREKWFSNRFTKHARRFGFSQTFRETASKSAKPVIETIAVCGLLIIVLLLFWEGREFDTVIAVLTLFGAATVRLMPAIKDSMTDFTNLRYYIHTVNKISIDTEALNSNPKVNKIEDNHPIKFKYTIQFNDVSYSYPESKDRALENISFNIKKGQLIGFIGSSGAGKTTLVDLLLGLLKVQEGQILVDGLDISGNIHEWQNNVGYIPQFIFLADTTLKSNIAYGLPDDLIDDEKLNIAIKSAQLDALVRELPLGVETIVGERGIRLSGGQRQRIGIARALYNNPSVLIMDEATSALDNLTEKYVIEAIEQLRGDKTIIMIAHRLSTVKSCDILYYLEEGKLIKSGSYSKLLETSEKFRNLAME